MPGEEGFFNRSNNSDLYIINLVCKLAEKHLQFEYYKKTFSLRDSCRS